jgi:chaperone required for assembly of F1-ATPase
MRDLFTEIFENQPLDPTEAARRNMRPSVRKRFYQRAHVGEPEAGGFTVLLDGRPVKTPARRDLAAPTRALAEALAGEWDAQQDLIDPARMPLTRLANAIIDAVTSASAPVAAEVAKYLSTDLLFYRAGTPAGLVSSQARHWDPVLDWAREALGARFVLAEGVMHVAQPGEAITAARQAIPADPSNVKEIWRLGAVASITTLTGSALLALAVAHGALDAGAAWQAAHVDEDWQMQQWGRDTLALARRDYHFAEMQAAATVLGLTPSSSG